jgi:ATP-binding cassette subfamily C (CFTR/MRP) protein 1
MNFVERIQEYSNLPAESLHTQKFMPPKDWPQNGTIEFENVSLCYDTNLPKVLRNVTLKTRAGEKIGIIGRTGAGKSSFFQILFRMYEPSGRILIDDIDIKDLSLFDLRTRLTIIPVIIRLFISFVIL